MADSVGGKKDPAFLLYCTTWLQSQEVNALTLEQQGAYVRLLASAWLHGSIPADRDEIRGIIGMAAAPDEAFARVWSKLLSRLWVTMPGAPGRLINRRQEHERTERKARAEEMRARGQAGGLKRAELEASRAQAGGKQSASRDPSRNQAEAEAGGQAELKPSTSTSTTPDRQRDRGDVLVKEEGVPGPSYPDEARARAAGSLIDGVAGARRVRA